MYSVLVILVESPVLNESLEAEITSALQNQGHSYIPLRNARRNLRRSTTTSQWYLPLHSTQREAQLTENRKLVVFKIHTL